MYIAGLINKISILKYFFYCSLVIMLISEYGMGKVGFDFKASFLFSGVMVLLSEFLIVFLIKI